MVYPLLGRRMIRAGLILVSGFVGFVVLCSISQELCTFVGGMGAGALLFWYVQG